MEMQYRRLGHSGLKVSVLSFGSWVTFGTQLVGRHAQECMSAAYESGVNFFDNAEAYAGGDAERIMGETIRRLGWPRHSYVISTKLYFGLHGTVNMQDTLNRKYLMQGIDGSLSRLGLDYVDILYCHRPDPDTPVEETVWTLSDIVSAGKALYWGTSEWPAEAIRAAWDIADRHHLRKPVVEQSNYNLFWRKRIEEEYAPLYEDLGLGLTTFSPLSSGLLSGKYLAGIPKETRAAMAGYEWLRDSVSHAGTNQKIEKLLSVANDLGCSLAQLAIAWCASNPHVSSVITGASRVEQVRENMGALNVLEQLTPEVRERITSISL
jgi:voltage-dependent potassium channel beta subunit